MNGITTAIMSKERNTMELADIKQFIETSNHQLTTFGHSL